MDRPTKPTLNEAVGHRVIDAAATAATAKADKQHAEAYDAVLASVSVLADEEELNRAAGGYEEKEATICCYCNRRIRDSSKAYQSSTMGNQWFHRAHNNKGLGCYRRALIVWEACDVQNAVDYPLHCRILAVNENIDGLWRKVHATTEKPRKVGAGGRRP